MCPSRPPPVLSPFFEGNTPPPPNVFPKNLGPDLREPIFPRSFFNVLFIVTTPVFWLEKVLTFFCPKFRLPYDYGPHPHWYLPPFSLIDTRLEKPHQPGRSQRRKDSILFSFVFFPLKLLIIRLIQTRPFRIAKEAIFASPCP